VDYITKPLNPTIVEARVRTHLALKEKNEIIKKEREDLAAAMAKLQHDIDKAREIQTNLLPDSDVQPFPDALTIVSRYVPALAVGGDFYDIKALDSKHLGIVLADVCGHGMQAAFITGLIKTALELAGDARRWPEQFLDWLNRTLCQLTPVGSYATMIYCTYNIESRKLRYLNSGHQPLPILITPDGQAAPISNTSIMPLGLFEFDDIDAEPFTMEPGSKLLLATDGLTDAVDTHNEIFELDRVMAVVKENAAAPARELEAAVYDAVSSFASGAEPADDIAILAVEFH
jgi:serine phosphatase RsbU (regulator of sigma subunit)